MITKYNQYVNEEVNVFGALKNLFGKLLQNVDDELKKPVEQLTAKMSKTKNVNDMRRIVSDYLANNVNVLNNSLSKVQSIKDIKKVVKDNISVIYAAVDAAIKTLGDNKFTFQEVFADSPDSIKKLFNKNEKVFNKNVDAFTNNLLIKLSKQYGFSKDDILTKETPNQTVKENNINEELDNTDTLDKKPQEQKTDQQQVQDVQKNQKQVDNLKKVSEDIKKWFNYSIYKPLNIKLKKDQQNANQKGQIAWKTNNVTGANRMLDVIKGLDKNGLAEIRDLLIKLGHGQEKDYGTFGDPKK